MTRDESGWSRRSFLRSTATTATTALAASATAATTSLSGCSALPGGGGGEPNPPDYDQQAVRELVREPFPNPPLVFPVEIPASRYRAHEKRAGALLDSTPENPDIPNEAVAKRITRHRRDLTENIGEMHDEHTPRDRLGRWRYYRGQAAEVWGSYVAATDQYSPIDFRSRYDRLRAAYNDFEGEWNYRGADPVTALVVHHALEELVSRGRDAILTTGPFPTDPQAAVFEAGRMIQEHERAAASLEDAHAIRTSYVDKESSPPGHRLTFADATGRLRHPAAFERPREPYEQVLEEGASALDADIENGPARTAFEHARRTADFTDRDVQRALAQNDPATATVHAARQRLATRTFRATVDAIHANEHPWPSDISALRDLRADTVAAIEAAWSQDPAPLTVEFAAHPRGLLRELAYYYDGHELDDHDLARYVGTLYYARRYAATIPDVTDSVVDAITTK